MKGASLAMDVNDWERVLEAIRARIDWQKMTENSDAFLDLLRQFAREEKNRRYRRRLSDIFWIL